MYMNSEIRGFMFFNFRKEKVMREIRERAARAICNYGCIHGRIRIAKEFIDDAAFEMKEGHPDIADIFLYASKRMITELEDLNLQDS
jgi:hypothetical protein